VTPPRKISRRAFLIGAGGAAATLALARLALRSPAPAAPTAAPATPETLPAYSGWQDLYRGRWTWDRIAKGTHFVNCWYQRGCNWNVYVKDGVVFREEQVATYPQTNAEVPDFNPRGCQKGACYSERMADASRVLYPMKRAGARGEGRWKRISWDDALREITDAMLDVLARDGPGAIVWDMGTGATNGCNGLGLTRTNTILDSIVLDMNAEIGDHHPGAAATLGKISFASSADDLFHSDLILIWGGNPTYTQIPNAHFVNEARYHGARVVAIAPDYNASSIHADQWIPVNVASDAAFGLALAHVLLDEGLFDARFVAEQTDLPLLVRRDTRRLLRGSDLEAGGDGDAFFVIDRRSGEVREAPRASLALGDLDPALEGEVRVRTAAGEVAAVPVCVLLREQLARHAPELTERVTGVRPAVVRSLARRIAGAKAATILTQSNFSKFYHGLEMERAQILVMALAGQIGRKGSGMHGFPFLSLGGVDGFNVASGEHAPAVGMALLGVQAAPEMARLKLRGFSLEMILYELARKEYERGNFASAALFFLRHGDMDDLYGSAKRWDPSLPRPFADYLQESLAKGWQFAPSTPPRILFEVGGNVFRRLRSYDRLAERLLPKLDLLVTFDWRMSNTAQQSDLVLPAAGWYEKDDITWATPISPFAHVTTRAVDPLGESKSDWEFHCVLMETLQRRAAERGLTRFRDRHGEERRLDRVYEDLTFDRRFTQHNPEALLDAVLEVSSNTSGIGWKELEQRGFVRYTELGTSFANLGNATDIRPDETITALTWHTNDKTPWPTLTRRMQFYVDQDLFLELGEELPVHKDDPAIGGDHPLRMTGGHTRWSIHASWRDEVNLLRLQRGGPIVVIGSADARARGIADGDRVRVWNDVGAFELRAKVSPAVRPGQAVMYHAWEPYQFAGRKSHQSALPSPINPIQLAGGYFHLRPMMIVGEPGLCDRGTRVDIERVARA